MKGLVGMALLSLVACATTPAGLQREALSRMEICVGAAIQPELSRASCTSDVEAYCAEVHISCDPEWLWKDVQVNVLELAQ